MMAEAAIKFDFLKEKQEVAHLKKRMFEKYQLGKGKNMQKFIKEKNKRFLEDDEKGSDDLNTDSDDEGDGEPFLTKLAREADEKLKNMSFSLSEDAEIKPKLPELNIKLGLAKPKQIPGLVSKDVYVRIIKASNLPSNVSVVKADIQMVNLGSKNVKLS